MKEYEKISYRKCAWKLGGDGDFDAAGISVTPWLFEHELVLLGFAQTQQGAALHLQGLCP